MGWRCNRARGCLLLRSALVRALICRFGSPGFTSTPPPHLPAASPQEAAAAGLLGKPLTAKNVEEMLGNLGLPAEFATHSQVRARRGLMLGQRAEGWHRTHLCCATPPRLSALPGSV